jgi:hypothetical protein
MTAENDEKHFLVIATNNSFKFRYFRAKTSSKHFVRLWPAMANSNKILANICHFHEAKNGIFEAMGLK